MENSLEFQKSWNYRGQGNPWILAAYIHSHHLKCEIFVSRVSIILLFLALFWWYIFVETYFCMFADFISFMFYIMYILHRGSSHGTVWLRSFVSVLRRAYYTCCFKCWHRQLKSSAMPSLIQWPNSFPVALSVSGLSGLTLGKARKYSHRSCDVDATTAVVSTMMMIMDLRACVATFLLFHVHWHLRIFHVQLYVMWLKLIRCHTQLSSFAAVKIYNTVLVAVTC